MTDTGKTTGKPPARAERLKAALRENLRRRKAQGRERAGSGQSVTSDAAEGGPDSDKSEL